MLSMVHVSHIFFIQIQIECAYSYQPLIQYTMSVSQYQDITKNC